MKSKIELCNDLRALKQCTDEAPEGTYMVAKAIEEKIGDTVHELIEWLRENGLKAGNCDSAYLLEAQIYEYIKNSNPESNDFACAEGFGRAMESPHAARIKAEAARIGQFFNPL